VKERNFHHEDGFLAGARTVRVPRSEKKGDSRDNGKEDSSSPRGSGHAEDKRRSAFIRKVGTATGGAAGHEAQFPFWGKGRLSSRAHLEGEEG